MGSQNALLPVLLLLLHLCLVCSQNQTQRGSTPANFANDCPQGCQCAADVKGHTDVSCHVTSQLDWGKTCKALELFSSDRQTKLKVRLEGTGDALDSGLECLPPLMSLDLSDTSLNLISHMFKGLKVDSSLNLSSNGIAVLPSDTFSGVESIGELDLSHNKLIELNTGSFAGLHSIKTLNLNHNNISVIHIGALTNLSQLVSLNLASNNLPVFSFRQLSPNISLDFFSLRNNYLTSLYLESNKTEVVPFHEDSKFDISDNLIECSCSLAYFLQALPFPEDSLMNVDNTVCDAPDELKGQSIARLDSSGLVCTAPHIYMSYPLKQKDLLSTSSITLECHASGFPRPSILWITPWGDHFVQDQAHIPSTLQQNLNIDKDEIRSRRKYKERNVLMVTHMTANTKGHLVISKIRGSMYGNYSCLAFNPAGNATKVMLVSVYCGIRSTYTYSLILGGYCASGFLIFGFLVGFIKMMVVWVRHKLYFIVPYFSKAVSTATGHPDHGDFCSASGYNSVGANPRSGDGGASTNCGESFVTCPHSPGSLSFIEEDFLEEDEDLGEATGGSNTQALRQHRFRDTLEEARGRWRDGVERKMELVRKNVQHIRESSSNYVHNIKETGSSAALRMKAGVAHGVETVKYQLQSFKELCGTGDMGNSTISTVTLETDIDSHQQSKVVKQITFV